MKTKLKQKTGVPSLLDGALLDAARAAESCVGHLRAALSRLPETGTAANLAAAQLLAHIGTASELAAALKAAPDGQGGDS
jgi:hypothetical protein